MEHDGLAQPGRAELALGRGQAALAVNLLERHLRRLPPADRLERVTSLELLVRACLAARDLPRVQAAVQELEGIAARVGTDPFNALVNAAQGLLLAAQGALPAAQRRLEDAADLFLRCGSGFEAARVQLALAEVLCAQGLRDTAAHEALAALDALQRLGALHEAERAQAVLALVRRPATAAARQSPSAPSGLSTREAEVLALVAVGKSNQEIAAQLVLSVRTVERHISTIYQKLGVSGGAARAAATAYALGHLGAVDQHPTR